MSQYSMDIPQPLTVISFVGPSGAGKSTGLKSLESTYHTLPERYMELNIHRLDNRLMLSKWAYIQYWFNGVLQAMTQRIPLLLTDRCPLDTCAYVSKGNKALWAILTQSLQELSLRGITVRKVLVTAPFDTLQERIIERLNRESERIAYNESNANHNKNAYDFYSRNSQAWDHTIDTSVIPASALASVFEIAIRKLTSQFSP